jgi:acetolactate synthase-1/2/3 large subunit
MPEKQTIDVAKLDSIVALLRSARRPVIYAGQGCNRASNELIKFAELVNAPVIMTRSGRGVVPMDHRLALAFDYNTNGAIGCNALLAAADLILVLGCKLGHNGTAGFRIEFPPDKTVRVDSSAHVLRANYPAAVGICAAIAEFLSAVLARQTEFSSAGKWTDADLVTWRNPRAVEWGDGPAEPKFTTSPNGSAKYLFDMLRRTMPRDVAIVTDSGLHQVLTFRYWRSLCPAGIIAPSDFQSMGFGIPAAIGAKFACPERHVVAIIGDGGLAMAGLELLTAVREKLQLSVIVFNDGALGQIRVQQLSDFGAAHATTLFNPDFSAFAESIGADHVLFDSNLGSEALNRPGVTLVEVPIEDSVAIKATRAKGTARRAATAIGGRGALRWLKSQLRKQE